MKKGPVIAACAVICLIGAILGIVLAVTGNDGNTVDSGNGDIKVISS